MEGSESAINRFGRAIWTVWGYLRGTVGRYLRPEVTNEEAHNLHFKQEDSETISKSYIELKEKEEGKEQTETKSNETRDDLQYPGVRVRAAAVQWESIAHGGHEVKDKSKHICHSSEDKNKKSQTKSDNEQTLENQEKLSAYIDAGIKNRDSTLSGSEEADRNAERREQEQTKKLEKKEEEKTMMRENDKTEKEHLKCKFVNQDILAKEANLSVERSEKNQEQEKASEKHVDVGDVDEIMRQENDETRTEQSQEKRRKQKEEDVDIMRKDKDKHEKETLKSEFIDQCLLTNEADIIVERNENGQEQKRKQEEEDKHVDEIIKRENEVPEKEPTKSQFVEQVLLTKEAALNVERSKSCQEQKEAENGDKIIRRLDETGNENLTRDNNENDEEPSKCEFIDQGLLTNEADLNVESEGSQEQRRKPKEEAVHEIMGRDFDETGEELIQSIVNERGLLCKEAELNVKTNKNNQVQIRKSEEKDEVVDEILTREYDEAEEELIKSEFVKQDSLAEETDLNDERNENQEKRRNLEEKEEVIEEISKRGYDESEEEPIKSDFIIKSLLAVEADLNVEKNEKQEQRRKLEKEEKSHEQISRGEYDKIEEELIKSEIIKQDSLDEETNLNFERNENQEQRWKLENDEEEESTEEISIRVHDESKEEPIKSEFIQKGLLVKKTGKRNDNEEQKRKSEEEEKDLEEISRREFDDSEEEPIANEFIIQSSLAVETELSVEKNENQEQRRKLENKEEDLEEISSKEFDESKEPSTNEFIEQNPLAEETYLNVERNENQEQRWKLEKEEGEKGIEEISRKEFDQIEKEPSTKEFIKQGSLAEETELNVESNENQEQRRKLEEEEESIEEISRREIDESEEEPITNEFIKPGLLAEEADLNDERSKNQEQRRKLEKEEESIEGISRREHDESEEEPIKMEFIKHGSLAEEADLNIERNEILEKRRKLEKEEEGLEQISRREYDEGEEEPIKSEFITQGSLAEEADLNTESNENQEQIRKLAEDEQCIEDISMKEYDESEEEPIKMEFIEHSSLAEEADINIERNEILEQRREEEEEGLEQISRREYDEGEEEPIKSEFITQGSLAEEADLNAESNENQEQRRKLEEEEESIEEISRREYDEGEEELIKSGFIKQGLLAEDGDLNAERYENLQQRRKLEKEEESLEEISRKEHDEGEEEPIKSEFITQGSLVEEADQNAESNENQERRRKSKEEGLEEISIKSELVTPGLLAEEADLNLERNENQKQARKLAEDDQCIEDISMKEYDESEEEPIKMEFIEHGSLAEEADLNIERNEILEQRRKLEKEEEGLEEISRREYDEGEEEPIKSGFIKQGLLAEDGDLNAETNENQKQRRKQEEESTEEISTKEYDEHDEEPIKSDFTDHGFDPEEQAGVCEMENKAVTQLVSVEKITECVYDQDINELNVITEHENEVSKSQMVDEGMFIQLASTQEVRSLLNDTSVLHEKEVIEGHNEETNQETVGKEKDGHHKEFSACEHVTDTGIVEEQKVCGTELKQFDVIDSIVVIESDLLEMVQIEMAEMFKKGSEPSRMFDDEDNSLVATMKLQVVEQSNEQKADSEMILNIDLNSSEIQQPAIVTQENIEGVITRPETDTGNQTETVKTTPKFRAEAAAVEVKKSPEKETSSYKQPIEREEVAVQEKTGQCFLEQWSLLEEPDDTRINELRLCEAPLSEVKSVSLERVDELAVESIYEMQSSSFEEECSSETALKMKAMSSSPGQTPGEFETLSEETLMSRGELKYEQAQPNCSFSLVEKPIFGDDPLEDKIHQDKYTVQDSAAEVLSLKHEIGYSEGLCLLERESEQETLDMPKNSQKDTQEQELIDKAEPGLLDEIKDVTSRFGVMEEIISDLTKKLDERRNDHESEHENLKEMSESNKNVELLTDTTECEVEFVAEITDIESIGSISTIGEMESGKKTEEPITEEEKDKCQLVFSETTASKEISKELKEEIEHGESVMDSKEDKEERDRSGQKRGFEKVEGDNDKDKPSGLTDLLFPLEASSLDFTVQKSKIAVKNPLIRPPKDPRMLINMPSVEPLTPPQPTQPSFIKKSPLGGASIPKGVIGFKLPGLGAGFPALRKTEAGKKIRDGEDTESVTSQKSDSSSQSADDNVKQETLPPKPKWTPPRQPGMGSPMMMAELKSKLRKPAKE